MTKDLIKNTGKINKCIFNSIIILSGHENRISN